MTINIKDLKNKIIYRANYRGTKEMDKLLGSFTKKYIDQFNEPVKTLGSTALFNCSFFLTLTSYQLNGWTEKLV